MKNALGHHLIFVLLIFLACQIFAQEAIFLENPSFEDKPRYASVPGGWRNCAFNRESPPDIHPVENGAFRVTQKPQDGNSYLGLVVRENATAESIGQQLSDSLQAGQCYSFSLHLCRSETLMSIGRISRKMSNYDTPVLLKIWGGVSPCGKRSLLATSPVIEHLEWKNYTFQFQPEVPLNWISLEAYFEDGTEYAYNGNLLLDNTSPIVPIDCQSLEPLIEIDKLKTPSFDHHNINAPKSNLSAYFFSNQGRKGYWVELRVVKDEDEIERLIIDNCPRIGFIFGTSHMDDQQGIGMKEVAANVRRFKSKRLAIGIPALDKKLIRKREKNLRRVFRGIGLSPRQYRIELIPPFPEETSWFCGQKEIWLKLEDIESDD